MNDLIKKLILITALAMTAVVLSARVATGQTFANLHNFTSGTDGAYPVAGLVMSGGILYGTDVSGGSLNGPGVAFSTTTSGANFTPFNIFPDPGTFPSSDTNVDGLNPYAKLLISGNTLYGAAENGGANANGTIFSVAVNDTAFSILHTFSGFANPEGPYVNNDGGHPSSSLILSGSTLYGTTVDGGANSAGIIFSVAAGGGSFVTLHNFDTTGYEPLAGLILSGGKLYGTTSTALDQVNGPTFGTTFYGTIFSMNTDGSGYTNIYVFTNNANAATPAGSLIISGNTLYGTASSGGSGGSGAIFSIRTNGSGLTILHAFTAMNNSTNSDGAIPVAGLLLTNNMLYGTAQYGGLHGSGTVFALSTNGTGFKTLYNFSTMDPDSFTNSDGANPSGDLLLSGNTLYSTAQYGGSYGYGTLFSLTLPPAATPEISIARVGASVILSWSTNLAGHTLQSTTNLAPSPVWNSVTPAPVVTAGNYVVTNSIAGTRRFYRLSP